MRALASLLTALLLCCVAPAARGQAARPPYKVLVFTHTTGYRHASIPAGVAEIRALGRRHGFTVTTTGDPSTFTDQRLKPYAAVVFLSTTGNPLPRLPQRQAFQRYIAHGGGYLGVHAASDLSVSWPWYTHLVGASFSTHPRVQLALVHVEDHHNPATAGLRDVWRLDEWYDFSTDPRAHVHVLADVDDSSYTGSTMGTDHPVSWCHDFDGGRSFYTAMGHTVSSYGEPWFDHQLLGAIRRGRRTAERLRELRSQPLPRRTTTAKSPASKANQPAQAARRTRPSFSIRPPAGDEATWGQP